MWRLPSGPGWGLHEEKEKGEMKAWAGQQALGLLSSLSWSQFQDLLGLVPPTPGLPARTPGHPARYRRRCFPLDP